MKQNIIFKFLNLCLTAMVSLTMTSCLDTIILPDHLTVDEDFWQNKSQVSAMVNAAYAEMASAQVMERLIVWGEFRSDEVVLGKEATGTTHDALEEIAAVNMQTTNMYASWASLYSVINRCNIVLARAAEVMDKDPNYTEGDYNVDRSHMLALRSLCYFYLVRNYRDIPYSGEAFMNSSQNMQIGQSAPMDVINRCIADLEEAALNAYDSSPLDVGQWRRVGWMTRDAINTLLADIYLWRAAVTHSAADYQKCIDYCDMVIASKKGQHRRTNSETGGEKPFYLATAENMYGELFVNQNAEESIFEIQCRANTELCRYYYKWSDKNGGYRNSSEGLFKASSFFANASSKHNVTNTNVFITSDMRYYGSCFSHASSETTLNVRKMISNLPQTNKEAQARDNNMWTNANLNQNFPVYRLTDAMLMRAEAFVELSANDANPSDKLREAFNMVQAVSSRAIYAENQDKDSIKWADFSGYSKDQMELFVMQERVREFCFEGKRWYDLLRYHYRHVNGSDYTKTYGQMQAEDAGFKPVSIYPKMLELMTRAEGSNAAMVVAKMQHEAFLYLPVPNSDIIVCPLLRQNPAYGSTNEYEKTY